MQIRKLIITTVISGILVIGAVTVGAQEDTGRRSNLRTFGQSELIQEYTGLTGQELLVALQDGSTIAELIEANGESVDAFIAEAMTGAEEVLIERLNEPITINRNLSLGNVFDYAELVEEFTGMTTQEVREAIVDDSTLGELIEANGESIDAFVVEVMASVQTRADEAVEAGTIDQEAADERLTQFEDTLTQGLEEGFDFNFGDRNRGLRLGNVLDYAELVEEFTGMTTQEVREAIVDDSTLGELIEANGESIDDFVVEVMASVQTRADEAVEAGTIDQEAADERLTQFEDTLTQGLEEGFDFNFGNRNRGGRR